MIWFGIACALGVQVYRLTKKVNDLESGQRGIGHETYLLYKRLNVHSLWSNLLSEKDIDDIEGEMPMSSCDWDKDALQREEAMLKLRKDYFQRN